LQIAGVRPFTGRMAFLSFSQQCQSTEGCRVFDGNESCLFYKRTTSLLSHCVGVKGIWPVKSLNPAAPGGLYGNLA